MICRRCQKPFKLTKLHRTFSNVNTRKVIEPKFCEVCMLRNFIDGIDEVMPPELLDPYTKNPALTGEEFDRSLKKK